MRFGGLTAVEATLLRARGAARSPRVIGPNGAGKTTVFNCITGFYRPTAGAIVLQHPDGAAFALQTLPGHRIARRARVARTFQNIRLFAGMTVLENLLVAQHNALMPNIGSGLLAVFGLGGHAPRAGGGDRAGAAAGSTASTCCRAPTTRPARCPTATSAGSRSRAPCAPTRCCSASTSRPPGSTRARATSWPRC